MKLSSIVFALLLALAPSITSANEYAEKKSEQQYAMRKKLDSHNSNKPMRKGGSIHRTTSKPEKKQTTHAIRTASKPEKKKTTHATRNTSKPEKKKTTHAIRTSGSSGTTIEVDLQTDHWPTETSFTVTMGDTVVFDTGPGYFIQPNQLYKTSVKLPFGGDYVLTVHDTYGDGLFGDVSIWVLQYDYFELVAQHLYDPETHDSTYETFLNFSADTTDEEVTIIVDLVTDNWPSETSFTVTTTGGIVVFDTGSGYFLQPNRYYETFVTLPSSGDYVLTVHDTYGDGLFGDIFVYNDSFELVTSYPYDPNAPSEITAFEAKDIYFSAVA